MTDDELKALFEAQRREMRDHVDTTAAETRRHFDVMAEHLDTRLETLVATFSALDEKLDRRLGAVEAAIERTAADTQAMIKFAATAFQDSLPAEGLTHNRRTQHG